MNYLKDTRRFLENHLLNGERLESAVEAGWMLFALKNRGSHPLIRLLGLQLYLDEEEPLSTQREAVARLIQREQRKRRREEKIAMLQSLRADLQQLRSA